MVGIGNPHRVLNVMSSSRSESHFDGMGSFSMCCGEEDVIEAVDSAGGGWRGSGELGVSWVRSLVLTVSVTKDVEVDVGMDNVTGELVSRFTTESGRSAPMVGSKMRNCERFNESLSPACHCKTLASCSAVRSISRTGVVAIGGVVVSRLVVDESVDFWTMDVEAVASLSLAPFWTFTFLVGIIDSSGGRVCLPLLLVLLVSRLGSFHAIWCPKLDHV